MILNQDGSLVACHPTKQDANKHMAALYAQEGNMSHHSFVAPIDKVEWRESRTGKSLTLTGHAAVFDRWSEELSTFAGKFREKIAPGAFRKVLTTNPDVRLLFNHDENFPLARTKSGTLELVEDDHGLAVRAQLGATSYANDLKIAMERGDVDQMSFAFTVADDEWDDTDEETVTRTIRQVDKLFDVSVVTYPAYPDTDAAMRELRKAALAGQISHERFIQRSEDDETEQETQDSVVLEESEPESEPGDADQPEEETETVEEPPDAEQDAPEAAAHVLALAELRTEAEATLRSEKENYLRLLREITK